MGSKKSLINRFIRVLHDLNSEIKLNLRIPLNTCLTEPEGALLISEPSTELSICNKWEAEVFAGVNDSHIVRYPDKKIIELKDVFLVGDKAFPFLDKNTLLNLCPDIQKEKLKKIRRPIPALAKYVHEPVYHLTGSNHENHGHFILQHLPRLVDSLDIISNTPDIKILLAEGHKSWQMRYLKYFGIKEDQIIEAGYGTLRCRKLYYMPMFYGSNQLVQGSVYQKMKTYLSIKNNKNKGSIIYISRGDAPNRKLINESEVILELKRRFGDEVRVITLSKLTLEEQAEIYGSAKIIIGPQGQSFANLIFSENSKVIILNFGFRSEECGWAGYFRDLGNFMSNKTYTLYAEKNHHGDDDWDLSLDKLNFLLDHIES